MPAVGLFTQAFGTLAAVVSAGQGAGEMRRVIFPHPLNNQPEEVIRAATRERFDQIAAALVAPSEAGTGATRALAEV